MKAGENSRFKLKPDDFKADRTLKEERGWHKMDVRWLVTGKNMDSRNTVVGWTTMPPGVKSKHALHRHPNAEEWEFIVSGVGIKHVGDDTFVLNAGELAYIPRNVYHGLENGSDGETLVTLWGYCGASSLEEAGYFTPEDDARSGAKARKARVAKAAKPKKAKSAKPAKTAKPRKAKKASRKK